MSIFATRLREILKQRGMTQQNLADLLGMPRKTVNNYCIGFREPSIEVLARIGRMLGEDLNYLCGAID